jgi:hypothetical protein
MLTGLKSASDLLFISQELEMPDGGLSVTREVNLPLNTLERQIFVVTDIQAYVVDTVGQGSMDANQDIDTSWSISTQDLDPILAGGATGNIGNPRVLAAGGYSYSVGANGVTQRYREWGTDNATTGTPSDYIGIIATPDYYIRGQFNDAGGVARGTLYCRLVGYMAIANADTYAALVTQEVNSQ